MNNALMFTDAEIAEIMADQAHSDALLYAAQLRTRVLETMAQRTWTLCQLAAAMRVDRAELQEALCYLQRLGRVVAVIGKKKAKWKRTDQFPLALCRPGSLSPVYFSK